MSRRLVLIALVAGIIFVTGKLLRETPYQPPIAPPTFATPVASWDILPTTPPIYAPPFIPTPIPTGFVFVRDPCDSMIYWREGKVWMENIIILSGWCYPRGDSINGGHGQ